MLSVLIAAPVAVPSAAAAAPAAVAAAKAWCCWCLRGRMLWGSQALRLSSASYALLLLLLLQSMHAGAYTLSRLPILRRVLPAQQHLQQQLRQQLQRVQQQQQQWFAAPLEVPIHRSSSWNASRRQSPVCCAAAAVGAAATAAGTAAAADADAACSSIAGSSKMKREEAAASPAADQQQQQQQQQLSPEEQQLKAEREARKKAKEAEKAAKEAAKLARKKAQEEEERATALLLQRQSKDVEADRFGYLPLAQSQQPAAGAAGGRRQFVAVGDLDKQPEAATVWVRGRLQDCRCKGSLAFLILREGGETVQCVFNAETPKDMLRWLAAVPLESLVDVLGFVTSPETPVISTSQKKELQGTKLFCVVKAKKDLPFVLKDAAQPEDDREDVIRVNLDTRLDNRCFELRVPAMRATARAVSFASKFAKDYLFSRDFVEIHSPKIIPGASEGGASCFKLPYFGKEACLAQSPQLYKQMAIAGDLQRVFEIGPVFRAENSNTHRHLCEFVGLDLEMEIKEHFMEAVDVIDSLFKYIFKHLETEAAKETATIRSQFPVSPFVYLEKTPMLTFKEGIAMLREAGIGRETIPDDLSEFDLPTELERALGQLVKEKFHTDYFFLLYYPAKARPFYSMPNPEDPVFSNTFDVFMRGEEIASGAQRIHDASLLRQRCAALGVPQEQLKSYIEAMELGAPPHAGMGAGLERIVLATSAECLSSRETPNGSPLEAAAAGTAPAAAGTETERAAAAAAAAAEQQRQQQQQNSSRSE
ncbi:hypothetical protein Efla_006540 [Eimeria flavescens]